MQQVESCSRSDGGHFGFFDRQFGLQINLQRQSHLANRCQHLTARKCRRSARSIRSDSCFTRSIGRFWIELQPVRASEDINQSGKPVQSRFVRAWVKYSIRVQSSFDSFFQENHPRSLLLGAEHRVQRRFFQLVRKVSRNLHQRSGIVAIQSFAQQPIAIPYRPRSPCVLDQSD